MPAADARAVSRFEFALAGAADDAQLRRRMAEVWMEGRIALSFRREPSYFEGCRLQGEQAQVMKCVDLQDRSIVGMGSRLCTTAHVNGRLRRIGYLADLRAMPGHRRGTLLARAYHFLHALHRNDPVPFYYTVILDGNVAALTSLVGARAGLPHYLPLGRVLTPALHLDFARPPLAVDGIDVRRATDAELPEIAAFLRAEAPLKQFSPAYADSDFASGGRLDRLKGRDFFIARGGGQIRACLAAWDQAGVRQTHIERYSPALRALRPFYNLASVLTPLKPLPASGERLPHLYLSCVAVHANDVQLFRALLRFAYNALRTGPWHYAIAGLHESDPLAAVLVEYRRVAAAGCLFLVHYREDGDSGRDLDARIPYIEMALT